MGVPNLFKEFKHFSSSRRLFSLVASISSSSDAVVFYSDQFRRPKTGPSVRLFSASAGDALSSVTRNRGVVNGLGSKRKIFSDIVDAIRRNESDFESILNRANVSLSVASVSQIFYALNSKKLSALRFFDWIRDSRPGLSRNHEICSLLIDNFGRLKDFDSMTRALNEFRKEQICLTRNAFRFLPASSHNDVSLANSVTGVVNILNGVGGSCRNSGVRSLIEMFACLGSFEMAKLVMRITEVNASYYNILIREACRRCDTNGARALLGEMRLAGCEPNTASHNLVLSVLCKSVEGVEVLDRELEAMDCPRDEITFEIVILRACSLGELDFALELRDRMPQLGLEPRISTHAAFLKAYCNTKRYEEAHKYVVDWSTKHRQSSNLVYSLLAELHLKSRNVDSARVIVLEMVEKDLKPSFRVYSRLLECLRRSGRDDLAGDLEERFSGLSQQTTTETR